MRGTSSIERPAKSFVTRLVMVYPRKRRDEWMDQPDLSAEAHLHALQGLRRIHRWTGTSRPFCRQIREWSSDLGRPLSVLDVACGGGELLADLARVSDREQVILSLAGCDINLRALDVARCRLKSTGSQVELFQHDVLNTELPRQWDVVVCSLFLHHLETEDVVKALNRMADAARVGMLVSDLVRVRLNRAMVWLASHALTRSPVVHFDGPVSVDAAFLLDEMRVLAADAGLAGIKISSQWPARMFLEWRRP